jgi:hypothetical protein
VFSYLAGYRSAGSESLVAARARELGGS